MPTDRYEATASHLKEALVLLREKRMRRRGGTARPRHDGVCEGGRRRGERRGRGRERENKGRSNDDPEKKKKSWRKRRRWRRRKRR